MLHYNLFLWHYRTNMGLVCAKWRIKYFCSSDKKIALQFEQKKWQGSVTFKAKDTSSTSDLDHCLCWGNNSHLYTSYFLSFIPLLNFIYHLFLYTAKPWTKKLMRNCFSSRNWSDLFATKQNTNLWASILIVKRKKK